MPETSHKTQTFRFDEMAVLVNDKIDNPAEAGDVRYVGLEHLDPDSLKIRRWGATTDVEASKLVFKSGDIIFGKRRVYQRKLAIADFDGICSAHAMVLRAKSDVVLPGFLPFFMQSDIFMERALEISVGSLSPTINWKTLAAEEFTLPPLEEQWRIAEAMQASKQLYEALLSLTESLLEVRRSAQNELLFPSCISGGNELLRLDDLTEINPTDPQLDSSAPFFPMDSLVEWERQIPRYEERGTRGGARARSGDVLMARITPCLENGKIAQVPSNVDRCGASTEFIVFRPRPGVSNSYVYWLVTSDRVRNTAIALMSGTTGRQRVSGKDLEGVLIPRLSANAMGETSEVIDAIELHRKKQHARAAEAKSLHFRLLNELTSGNSK